MSLLVQKTLVAILIVASLICFPKFVQIQGKRILKRLLLIKLVYSFAFKKKDWICFVLFFCKNFWKILKQKQKQQQSVTTAPSPNQHTDFLVRFSANDPLLTWTLTNSALLLRMTRKKDNTLTLILCVWASESDCDHLWNKKQCIQPSGVFPLEGAASLSATFTFKSSTNRRSAPFQRPRQASAVDRKDRHNIISISKDLPNRWPWIMFKAWLELPRWKCLTQEAAPRCASGYMLESYICTYSCAVFCVFFNQASSIGGFASAEGVQCRKISQSDTMLILTMATVEQPATHF